MDFQQLLNLVKGNLGGQGMHRAEDGSMVHAGYYDKPAVPVDPVTHLQEVLRHLLGK